MKWHHMACPLSQLASVVGAAPVTPATRLLCVSLAPSFPPLCGIHCGVLDQVGTAAWLTQVDHGRPCSWLSPIACTGCVGCHVGRMLSAPQGLVWVWFGFGFHAHSRKYGWLVSFLSYMPLLWVWCEGGTGWAEVGLQL